MMRKRILVDAAHAEETRVVVLENGRVQEFDSETTIKNQIKGNIYLAKVTRVEPSLQSAFVEYGENRHGFLPFSEIHPLNYNIPVDDKDALLKEIREERSLRDSDEVAEEDGGAQEVAEDDLEDDAQSDDDSDDNDAENEEGASSKGVRRRSRKGGRRQNNKKQPEKQSSATNLYRRYKIQEVIKRNQILLVQVEKEERGNKGASLTTFISLAGRYCVFMPNSLRKGGVSRKVSDNDDRKRLKDIINGLEMSDEAGMIVRTAGAGKSKQQILDDYNYLTSLWEDIKERTYSSTAPAFIHAEGDLVKRTLRDMFADDVDEVLIEGKSAYASAKEFTKILMPDQLKAIKQYRNKVPIFTRYKVEEQIALLYSHEADLESGGAIVINPTEALISIDVNSGKSTSQRNVEETALSTNLEAAREVARQLRLRDLSGLIVVDFIDMLDIRNRKAVERELKQACDGDRAKVQIGRISTFGLLEMSRQRLRPSFLEINTMECPTCGGSGAIKAAETVAVTVLRAVESDLSRKKTSSGLEVSVNEAVAVYILNHKRGPISRIEREYKVKIYIYPDAKLEHGAFTIEEVNAPEPEAVPVKNTQSSNDAKSNASSNDRDNRKDTSEKPSRGKAKRTKKSGDGLTGLLGGIWKKIVD